MLKHQTVYWSADIAPTCEQIVQKPTYVGSETLPSGKLT